MDGMDGWMNGWDGWDGWMNGWDGCMHACMDGSMGDGFNSLQ